MISVCMECKRVLGDKEPFEDKSPSHGICIYCHAFFLARSGFKGRELAGMVAEGRLLKVSYREVRLLN